MRRKQQNNNYRNKGRHSGGRGGQKKNYGAMKEKYLNQARDAQSSGDRVMAEYYYQHAEHCFRMMAEDSANNNRPPRQQNAQPENQYSDDDEIPVENKADDKTEKPKVKKTEAKTKSAVKPETKDAEQLPAFITTGKPQHADEAAVVEAKE